MDNPVLTLTTLDDQAQIVSLKAQKRYYIHMIMRMTYNQEIKHKHLVLVMTRAGIVDVKEVD